MNIIFDNKNRILKELINICKENNLWYSADNQTLLQAYSNKNNEEIFDHHDIMMTYDSYKQLKKIVPNRLIDGISNSEYYGIQAKFVDNYLEVHNSQPFVNINFVISTNLKNLKQYTKLKTRNKSKINYFAQMNLSTLSPYKTKIRFAKLFKKFVSNLNYKDVFNLLNTQKYEGYIITSKYIKSNVADKWLSNFNFETETLKIEDNIEIQCIVEADKYLNNLYGNNYQNKEFELSNQIYISPVDIINHESKDIEEVLEQANNDNDVFCSK
ncbi:LicD family protein [[Mycoplasma] falconis]|uniref:LicD family protein n=1 Tax=[Mycoplasma] falconis TaxID=92403 RepID=A0A501XAD6_9BACT|nr:LicD family protein [[Mycoplasma] falconis]TPE57446.1 LicD family protein [[Mycoplasma] falconis]